MRTFHLGIFILCGARIEEKLFLGNPRYFTKVEIAGRIETRKNRKFFSVRRVTTDWTGGNEAVDSYCDFESRIGRGMLLSWVVGLFLGWIYGIELGALSALPLANCLFFSSDHRRGNELSPRRVKVSGWEWAGDFVWMTLWLMAFKVIVVLQPDPSVLDNDTRRCLLQI